MEGLDLAVLEAPGEGLDLAVLEAPVLEGGRCLEAGLRVYCVMCKVCVCMCVRVFMCVCVQPGNVVQEEKAASSLAVCLDT